MTLIREELETRRVGKVDRDVPGAMFQSKNRDGDIAIHPRFKN